MGIIKPKPQSGKKSAFGEKMPNEFESTYYLIATGTVNLASLTVTGLDFKPSKIIVEQYEFNNSDEALLVYSETGFDDPISFKLTRFTSQQAGSVFIVKANMGDTYVNETGFKIPISNKFRICRWWAYE